MFFQEPGVAERALEADVRESVVAAFIGLSGDAPEVNTFERRRRTSSGTFAESALPGWLTKEDIDHYTEEYERTGYRVGSTGTATLVRTGS